MRACGKFRNNAESDGVWNCFVVVVAGGDDAGGDGGGDDAGGDDAGGDGDGAGGDGGG